MGTDMFRTILITTLLLFSTYVSAELKPGAVAIYSDGSVEKLLQQGDGWSLWEDARKRRYSRSDLPFMPILQYAKYPDRKQGYTHHLTKGEPQALMPFGQQDKVRFYLQRDSQSARSSRRWDCSYLGRGTFTLRKTKMKVEKYECSRYAVKTMKMDAWKETILLKYSPHLGVVVDRHSTSAKGQEERVKLVRILAPEKVTAKRIARTVYKLRASK